MKYSKLSVILIFTLLITACSTSPLVQDLKAYPAVIKSLVNQEIEFSKAYTTVKENLTKNPDLAFKVTNETLIPKSADMVATAEKGSPQSEGLQKVHTHLLNAITTRHNALLALKNAIESKEAQYVQTAFETLEKAIAGFNEQFVLVNATLEQMKMQQ